MKFGRREPPSSHWTTALSDQWFWGLLLLLTLLHGYLASVLPLSEDELYYLTWSKALSFSYFDHPPLVAVLIRISTAVFGDSAFGIRFFAVLAGGLIVICLSTLVRSRRLLTMALFTPLFFWASILMTPDVPLLLLWTVYYLWTTHTANRLAEWRDDPIQRVYQHSPVSIFQWTAGGLVLGLGLLSKYSMAVAPFCLLLNLTSIRRQAWWKGFLCHLVVALILLTPVLIFNVRHNFSPLLFQWNHGTRADTVPFRFFGEYVLSQCLLVGLLPLIVFLTQWLRLREILEVPRSKMAFLFFTVPFLLLLLQAAHTKVEANWAIIAYSSFWVHAQLLLDHSSFKREATIMAWIAFIPAFLVTALVAIHLCFPLTAITASKDRIGRLKEQEKLFHTLAQALDQPLPVFATTYQTTAQLRFQRVMAYQLPNFGRASHFTLNAVDPCSFDSILVLYEGRSAPVLSCFGAPTPVATYPLTVKGESVYSYTLVRYNH